MAKDRSVKKLQDKNIRRKIKRLFLNLGMERKQDSQVLKTYGKSGRFGYMKLRGFCPRKRSCCHYPDGREEESQWWWQWGLGEKVLTPKLRWQ